MKLIQIGTTTLAVSPAVCMCNIIMHALLHMDQICYGGALYMYT